MKGSIIITGANGGLGTSTVGQILQTPHLASAYTGLYTVRKATTATGIKKALAKAASSNHRSEILELDLSSLESVRKFANSVNQRVATGELPRIRALILNAGYQEHTTITMSKDGFEMTWQVNYLSNVLLALLLLQSMDPEHGRILLIGSWSHDVDDEFNKAGGYEPYADPKWQNLLPDLDALAKGKWSTPDDDSSWYSGYRRYGASKLCAVMFQHELAHRIAQDPNLSNIRVLGLDPGGMASDLGRRGDFVFHYVKMKFIMPLLGPFVVSRNPNGPFRTTAKSAKDVIRACFEIEPPKGKPLYLNGSDEKAAAKETRDVAKMKLLWDYGNQAAGVKDGDTILSNWR
ncbi:hypothetical protein B0I35DRAFT_473703 [Stachybotrys elegans]|uniref:Ketoreductase (KR) domain-containing protein n=1 Tax=Stachybotrys elegans TaxID=80388 RepID=A0A8K0T826_9HYPO|nr:hypothetical protein B0I35DRAFT_473703 [Stachybotrys elegans]